MTRAWPSLGLAAMAATAAAGSLTSSGCGSNGPAQTTPLATRAELLDPARCGSCHLNHYADWKLSMHSQASDDPVFVAMNRRGQRATNGKLGTFCVQCHAPMAVRDGKTTDGLNLGTLDPVYKGVTCFFCHSIDSIGTVHDNASVNLATDLVMRGELLDAKTNPAHRSAYSTLHDSTQPDAAAMCGSCHDIDAPAGGRIERTFAEWSTSIIGLGTDGHGKGGSTCTSDGCHMTVNPQIAQIATNGPTTRKYHPHDFPAVDVPMVENPPNAAQVQNALNGDVLQGQLCVSRVGGITVELDAPRVGHLWPSGATQDRRAWVEVVATDANGAVLFSSGVVPDGTPVTSIVDPNLWLIRDCMFDAQSKPVNDFWLAASTRSNQLPTQTALSSLEAGFYTHVFLPFPRNSKNVGQIISADSAHPVLPAKVTARVRLQPVGLDVLDDLVSTGDLDGGPDGALLATMPTFDVSLNGPSGPAGLVWTPATATPGITLDEDDGTPTTCAVGADFVASGTPSRATSQATCAP